MVEQYVTVDSSNISSAIRDNCRKVLEDEITDPTNREKRHWVYDREPHTAGTDFEDYPVIYIEDYSAEDTDETVNDFRVTFEGDFEATVDVHEDNPEHLDSISDELFEKFKGGGTPRETLGEYGIYKISLEDTSRTVGLFEKDSPIIRRRFNISFEAKVDMG